MNRPLEAALAAIFCAVTASRAVLAQAEPDVRDAPTSLPGIVRVGIPVETQRTGLAVAGTAGYGFTESVLAQNDRSHRLFGSIAASFRPNDWFAAGLRLEGRYDWHRNVPDGNGGGAVAEPLFILRAVTRAGSSLRVGAEAGAQLPGEKAPSISFAAISPELSLLAAFLPAPGSIELSSRIGFRYDRSAQTVPSPDRLERADRLSLGVSDTNALLLGLGVVGRVAMPLEALAEWTWDLRVPSKGTTAMQSPMRVDVGARYLATETMAVQLVVEASPSSRPPVGPGTPLVVIEPRVSVFAGINFRPSLPRAAPPPSNSIVNPDRPAELTTAVRITGRVTDDGGHPIVGAKVHAGTTDAGVYSKTDGNGAFQVSGVPPGKTDVTVTAEGYRDSTRSIDVGGAGTPPLEVQLERALPSGQIRGLARSFAGQPIKGATVRIEPIGSELVVGEGGRFEVDVPPGEYDVIVKATGYADQHRHVRVEANGVVVLDLDMRTRR